MGSFGSVEACGQVTLPQEIQEELRITPGDVVTFRRTGPHAVELRFWPRLTLDDLIERYPITEPIDEAKAREEWQEVAAQEVFGSRHG